MENLYPTVVLEGAYWVKKLQDVLGMCVNWYVHKFFSEICIHQTYLLSPTSRFIIWFIILQNIKIDIWNTELS